MLSTDFSWNVAITFSYSKLSTIYYYLYGNNNLYKQLFIMTIGKGGG
jgi:hypothetical protein